MTAAGHIKFGLVFLCSCTMPWWGIHGWFGCIMAIMVLIGLDGVFDIIREAKKLRTPPMEAPLLGITFLRKVCEALGLNEDLVSKVVIEVDRKSPVKIFVKQQMGVGAGQPIADQLAAAIKAGQGPVLTPAASVDVTEDGQICITANMDGLSIKTMLKADPPKEGTK